MPPHVEASVHPMVCWFQLSVRATDPRLGGLYIRLTPAILRLLETRETPYTLKNISKPTQVHIDQILRLSTSFVSDSARISFLESVRARCCALWLVLE